VDFVILTRLDQQLDGFVAPRDSITGVVHVWFVRADSASCQGSVRTPLTRRRLFGLEVLQQPDLLRLEGTREDLLPVWADRHKRD
jgi:hypothetical protein